MKALDAIKARAEYAAAHIRQSFPAFPVDVAEDVLAADVPRLVAALEAVLELHQPYITRSAWQTCNECWNSGIADIVYPCPTVLTVERALKEEQA